MSVLMHAPVVSIRREPGPGARVGRVEHLAPDVQLKLSMGRVAHAHRGGALVPGQPRQLELGESPLAPEAVHDLELGGRAREGAEQPLPPGARLVEIAAQDQRVEREGRVPDPAQAVVPVAHAAQPLGQRGGRRGDDAAGGLVDHGLDRDEGAQHRVAVGALVGAAPGPLVATTPRSPRWRGRGSTGAGGGRCDGCQAIDSERVLAGRDGEVGDGGEPFAVERHVGGEEERVGPRHRPDAPGRAADPGHHRAVVHANHELHAHGDRAPDALDLAHDHRRPGALGHAVHDGGGSGVRLEGGLQDERVVAVSALRRARPRRAARASSARARARPAARPGTPGSRNGADRANRWNRRERSAPRSRRRRSAHSLRWGRTWASGGCSLTSPGRHVSVSTDFI